MTDDQRELLRKAADSLSASKYLLKGGYPDFVASRAYYTMFYVAEAFLEGEEMSFSKHSAVIAAFGKHFSQKGKVPVEFHRFFIEAQETRHMGDYGTTQSISHKQAKEVISRAEMFLEIAETLIGSIRSVE